MRIRLPKTQEADGISDSAPFNTWMQQMFPETVQSYGPGFLEGRYEEEHGDTRYVPTAMNEDAWAAALGGRADLRLQLVYFPPEAQFYFYDYRAAAGGAFCPTSAEKVGLLLSNYLMRCAQACPCSVDLENLVVKFRQPAALRSVVEKAKVILATCDTFFSGEKGARRLVKDKLIEPNAEPSYIQFVKKVIVRQPESKLTVADAFSRYHQFCEDSGEKALTRAEFKALVTEAIRDAFSLGLRHDITDARGKANHGWMGLECCLGRN